MADFFIVARTDSRQALGLDEAITRGIAFSAAGALEHARTAWRAHELSDPGKTDKTGFLLLLSRLPQYR